MSVRFRGRVCVCFAPHAVGLDVLCGASDGDDDSIHTYDELKN